MHQFHLVQSDDEGTEVDQTVSGGLKEDCTAVRDTVEPGHSEGTGRSHNIVQDTNSGGA